MLKDIDGELPTGAEWQMNVVDGGGEPIFTLRFVGIEHGVNAAANSN